MADIRYKTAPPVIVRGSGFSVYAQRLDSVFEASLKPEDFLRADMEHRKLLKSEDYTTED